MKNNLNFSFFHNTELYNTINVHFKKYLLLIFLNFFMEELKKKNHNYIVLGT